ncbi:aminotransferase [Ferroacidibacillus organovorans]|nr:aminotransferase [Ferroacidibacillus organovorans]
MTEPLSSEKALTWVERDREHMWHHMQPYASSQSPMIVARAERATLYDIDGNAYIDAMSGLWCMNLGYSERALADVAYEQMMTMPYYPLTQSHLKAIEISEKISDWLGGKHHVFLTNSGTEANETALKIARQYHALRGEGTRYKVISRYRAYHGNSGSALAATGQSIRKQNYEPLTPGFLHVPPPYCYRCPFGQKEDGCQLECASYYDQVITWEGKDTVAAVIMEPVITGGGVLVPKPGYLEKVREICDKHGVLMIVDEVICGFYRSGERFGHQNFNVKPDLVTMAKGITSGYLPLAATAVRDEIFDVFKGQGAFTHLRHLNTFGGNPSACAVATKTLELMEERQIVTRVRALMERMNSRLERLRDAPLVGDLRSFGFLAGIELVSNRAEKTPLDPSIMGRVLALCKQRGVIVGRNGDTVPEGNNVLTLCPPFIVTDEELDHIFDVIESALHTVADEQKEAVF